MFINNTKVNKSFLNIFKPILKVNKAEQTTKWDNWDQRIIFSENLFKFYKDFKNELVLSIF